MKKQQIGVNGMYHMCIIVYCNFCSFVFKFNLDRVTASVNNCDNCPTSFLLNVILIMYLS